MNLSPELPQLDFVLTKAQQTEAARYAVDLERNRRRLNARDAKREQQALERALEAV